jgi:nicotinamidase-related amidase
MMESKSILKSLIDVNDSILVVIDVQESFLKKLEPAQSSTLVNRIEWLINVAIKLNIPIILTAEDIPRHGSVAQRLAKGLPSDTHIYNKMIFNLADETKILSAVNNTGRNTCVLVGLETDVCIAHSAFGLAQKGYQIAVVEDATCSPEGGHAYGMERIRSAGVTVVSVKGLYYEWIRNVNGALEFKRKFSDQIGSPEGITM